MLDLMMWTMHKPTIHWLFISPTHEFPNNVFAHKHYVPVKIIFFFFFLRKRQDEAVDHKKASYFPLFITDQNITVKKQIEDVYKIKLNKKLTPKLFPLILVISFYISFGSWRKVKAIVRKHS